MPVGTAAQRFAHRYRLEQRLANGGQGEVWRAHDEVLDRAVAVKLIRTEGDVDPVALQRLEREARVAAGLTHPNVAQVLDYARDDGLAGIVMELLDGDTLAARIQREGPLPVDEAVTVGSGILAALAVAHEAGLVHRDVKPSNVMITGDGFVKVTDFGIAAIGDAEGTLTEPGTVMGSAPYLAPEQVRGERPTPAADLYSTGLVLYEALSGQLPFEADTPPALALARLRQPPVPLRARRADVPETLAAVVMRALQRDPRARFATADAMRGALEAAGAATRTEDTAETRTLPVPTAVGGDGQWDTRPIAPPVAPPGHRRWWALALFGLLVFLAGLFAANVLASRSDAPGSIEVPEVVGLQVEDAEERLGEAGLETRVIPVDSGEPVGAVLSQDVAAGVFVIPGTPVNLEVSSGTPPCCTVPSVVGMPLDQARQAVTDANLKVDKVEEEESDLAAGTVIDQDPAAGTEVEQGDAVDLLVAKEGDGDDDGDGPLRRGNGRGKD